MIFIKWKLVLLKNNGPELNLKVRQQIWYQLKQLTVDAGQPKIWTEREIAAMSLDQFDKYEEDIKQAMMEGRVVK